MAPSLYPPGCAETLPRTPHYPTQTLTKWILSRDPTLVARCLEYWLRRVNMDIRMLDEAEIVTRNA
jgi:hypothetical protein